MVDFATRFSDAVVDLATRFDVRFWIGRIGVFRLEKSFLASTIGVQVPAPNILLQISIGSKGTLPEKETKNRTAIELPCSTSIRT